MMKKERKSPLTIWNAIGASSDRHSTGEMPKITIVVPSFNQASLLSVTIESLLSQDYPDYQMLIIDCSSKDRTIETINGYRNERIQFLSVSHYHYFEMLNKGIAFGEGEYYQFLHPGDYYLFEGALKSAMSVALETERPELVYSASLERIGESDVELFFHPLHANYLKRGVMPTALSGCWFHKKLFTRIGKFSPHYFLQGGLDFLCRFTLSPEHTFSFTTHVLTDSRTVKERKEKILLHFKETLSILNRHFGAYTTAEWVLYQEDLSCLIREYFDKIRNAFIPP